MGGQLERCPNTGGLHYQLWVITPSNYRWTRLRKELGNYWFRPFKCVKQSTFTDWQTYCNKEGSRVTDPSFTTIKVLVGPDFKPGKKGRGARTDVDNINSFALQVLRENPSFSQKAVLKLVSLKFPAEFGRMSVGVERFVNMHHVPFIVNPDFLPWLWQSQLLAITKVPAPVTCRTIYFVRGVTGNEGKSALVDFMVQQHGVERVAQLNGTDISNMAFAVANMDEAPQVVIVDIPRTSPRGMWSSIMYMCENLANRKIFSGKYVSKFVMLPIRPHIVVCCNELPSDLGTMLSKDRVVVWDVSRPRHVTRIINGATELVEEDVAPRIGGIEAVAAEPFSAFTK